MDARGFILKTIPINDQKFSISFWAKCSEIKGNSRTVKDLMFPFPPIQGFFKKDFVM
jgi:hypothetical protein